MPGRWARAGRYEVEQRGLAGAVGTDEPDDVARGDVEITVGQRPAPAVPLTERPCADQRVHAMSSGRSPERCGEERLDALLVEAGTAGLAQPTAQVGAQRTVRGERRVGSVAVTKVPTPGRGLTTPSRSSSRYALRTVFGLMASDPTTSLTVGSWSPSRSSPRRRACLACRTICRYGAGRTARRDGTRSRRHLIALVI